MLVGSAAFMSLMDISPAPGAEREKIAVFCAIDGRLAGIFALNYTLPDTVFPAVEELLLEKVGPVLATRDFNLIPAMLRQRFKLPVDNFVTIDMNAFKTLLNVMGGIQMYVPWDIVHTDKTTGGKRPCWCPRARTASTGKPPR